MLCKAFLLISAAFQSFTLFTNPSDSLQQIILHEPSDSVKAFLYAQLSYEYLTDMELDSCMTTAKRGVLLSKKIGNETAALLNYEFEGQYFYYRGLYRQSIEVFTETLKEGEKIGRHDIVVRSYGMLGWIFIEQRRFNDALNAFEKSISICKKHRIEGEDLALNYYGLGSAYAYRHSNIQNYELGELYYDSALAVQPGLQIREKVYVLGELGSLYRDGKDDIHKSMLLLQEAERLIRNDKHHNDVYAYVVSEIAYNYSLLNDHANSRLFANKAVAIYDQLPFKRKMTSVYELLAETFDQIDDSKNAFRMEHLNRILSDSIFSLRNIELVEEINAQYEAKKKQREIYDLTQANLINKINLENSQNMNLIVSGASALVLILLSLNFYNRNRYQKKIKEAEIKHMVNEEKQRIAKDLHDNIGTQLTSLSLAIGSLKNENGLTQERVSHLRENIDATIVELRDTIWAIHKEEVTLEEFKDRIDNLFWRLQDQTDGIRFIVDVSGELGLTKLKPVQAVNLFRVVQEAVNNSLKHSGAKEISLLITIEKELQLIIKVSDNGKGFLTTNHPVAKHFGLINMRKRAEEMQGSLHVESLPDYGTTIAVICPL